MTSSTNDPATPDSGFGLQYYPIEDVEPLERYRPGGYHPVTIGSTLNSRYHIVHKLGFGTNSTIWLGRDQNTATYAAVKVLVADNAATEHSESGILRFLSDKNSQLEEHPGQAAISPLLDEFDTTGPNGTHRCLVTAPARVSVADTKDASDNSLFQTSVARAIAAQLIQGVAFLHSRGIVHSDIHNGNILLRLPKSIDSLSTDQLYEKYPLRDPEPVQRIDEKPLGPGVPTHGIMPVWIGKDSDRISLSEAHIFLTDFGESFSPTTTQRYYSNAPVAVRPPEGFFTSEEPLSFPADIWTLACAIFSILGQRSLFDAFFPIEDWIIKEHVDMLGRLPSEWWSKWESRAKWFDEDGERTDGEPRRPLEGRIEYSIQEQRREFGMEELSKEEVTALIALLERMLSFSPRERPSAKEVLESEWMNRWALRDLESMQQEARHQSG